MEFADEITKFESEARAALCALPRYGYRHGHVPKWTHYMCPYIHSIYVDTHLKAQHVIGH